MTLPPRLDRPAVELPVVPTIGRLVNPLAILKANGMLFLMVLSGRPPLKSSAHRAQPYA